MALSPSILVVPKRFLIGYHVFLEGFKLDSNNQSTPTAT